MQELPERWTALKKLAGSKKLQVASLQSHELNNIRQKISSFEEKQVRFREQFRRNGFFRCIPQCSCCELQHIHAVTLLFDLPL